MSDMEPHYGYKEQINTELHKAENYHTPLYRLKLLGVLYFCPPTNERYHSWCFPLATKIPVRTTLGV